MFPPSPGATHDSSEIRTIACTKKVTAASTDKSQWSSTTHANTLYIFKPIYGKTLSELSFSHPQHLVNMLPYIRQYVFLSTLLEKSFKGAVDSPSTEKKRVPATTTRTTTRRDDFRSFMVPTTNGKPGNETGQPDLKVDVTLIVHPVPRIQIVFPFRSSTADILLEIRENGQVHVESQNILDESNSVAPDGRARRAEDLGKCLETFEDIGKWCEFIRTRWT
jgi:hypothetical protein